MNQSNSRLSRLVGWAKRHPRAKWLVLPLLSVGYGASAVAEGIPAAARRAQLWFASPHLGRRLTALALAGLVLLCAVPFSGASAQDIQPGAEIVGAPEEDPDAADTGNPDDEASPPDSSEPDPDSAAENPDDSSSSDSSDADSSASGDGETPDSSESVPDSSEINPDDSSQVDSDTSDTSDISDSTDSSIDPDAPDDSSEDSSDDSSEDTSDDSSEDTSGSTGPDDEPAEDPPPAEGQTIVAFTPLAEDLTAQTYPVGTPWEDLSLPESLEATPAPDSGAEAAPADEAETDRPAVQLAVTGWQSEPAYDPDTAGDYLLTPLFDETVTLAPDLTPPTLQITLEAEEEAPPTVELEAGSGEAGSWEDLLAEIEYIADNTQSGTITLTDSFTNAGATAPAAIPAGVTITLKSDATPRTIGHDGGGNATATLFSVAGTLSLSNVTLDGGGSEAPAPLVQVDGTLNLGSAALLQNGGAAQPLAQVAEGGALAIANGATLQNTTGSGVHSAGTVTMTGGTIAGISGAGVEVVGAAARFSKTGGALTADGYNLVVRDDAQATVTGGTLSPGFANAAGAVYMASGQTTLTNVSLTGFSITSGGVIAADNGTLNIAGGSITGNTLGGTAVDIARSASVTVNLSASPTIGDGAAGARSGITAVAKPVNISGALSANIWFNTPNSETDSLRAANRSSAFTAGEVAYFKVDGDFIAEAGGSGSNYYVTLKAYTLQQRINRATGGTEENPIEITLRKSDATSGATAGITIAATDSGNAARHIRLLGDGVTHTRSQYLSLALFTVPVGSTLILQDITINGGGSTANKGALVEVQSGGKLTLTSGAILTSNGGRGVYVRAGGTFTMLDGTIEDNSANTIGAGVGVEATATFEMSGGVIRGNSAGSSRTGGGVHNAGTFTMSGGTITGNKAPNGGGVYNAGTFNLQGATATIGGNSTTGTSGSGGGVYNTNTFNFSAGLVGTANATGGNTAGFGGAGIYTTGALTLSGADALVRGNRTIGTSASGGGIYVDGSGSLDFQAGAITANTASGTYGGGVFSNACVVTMSGGSITGNTIAGGGTTRGAGIYIQNGGGLAISGGEISGNTGAIQGGGVCGSNVALTLSGGTIAGNTGTLGTDVYFTGTANSLTVSSRPVVGTAGTGGLYINGNASLVIGGDLWDGALLVYEGSKTADGDSVARKLAPIIGADLAAFRFMNADYMPVATTTASPYYVRIKDTSLLELQERINLAAAGTASSPYPIRLRKNETLPAQGLIIADTDNANAPRFVRIYNSGTNTYQISRGSATAAMITIPDGSGLTLQGVTVNGANSTGGPIVDASGALTLATGANLRGNAARGVDVAATGTLTIAGGTISNNKVAGDGAGVYNRGALTMSAGAISGNTASGGGGGVYNAAGKTFALSGGNINSNTANGTASLTAGGGGVYNTGTFEMSGGSIYQNKAPTTAAQAGGGGVRNNATFTLTGGQIYQNTTGAAGGGVYVDALSGTFTFSGGTISGNTASGDGGGINVYIGSLTLSGSAVVSGNTALGGGGISIGTEADFTLSGGTISNNTATGEGGGIASYTNSGSLFTITGGTLSGNKAKNGAGIYMVNAPTTARAISGLTLSANKASGSGGALYVENTAALHLSGSTLTGNSAVTSGGAIYNAGALTLSETAIGTTASPNTSPAGAGIYIDGTDSTAGALHLGADITFGGTNGLYPATEAAAPLIGASLAGASLPFEYIPYAQRGTQTVAAAADLTQGNTQLDTDDLAAAAGAGYNFALSDDNTQILVDLTVYSITYNNMAGATNHPDNPPDFTRHSAAITLRPASKADHQFDGWYSNDTFTASVTQIPAGTTQNIILYAKWLILYTVTYHANSPAGTVQNLPDPLIIAEGSNFNLSSTAPTLAGYRFDNWATSGSGPAVYEPGDPIANIQSHMDLYARWVLQRTLTFNGGGATSGVPSPITQDVDTDVTLTAAHVPTWYGHTFLHWLADDDTVYNTGNKVTLSDNITLTAQWRGATVVTFAANDSGGPAATDIPSDTFYHVTDEDFDLPDNQPAREGYKFLGWTIGPTGTTYYQPEQTVTALGGSTVAFTARWEKLHRVTYNGNGAGDPVTNLPEASAWVETGDDVPLSTTIPVRVNYEFDGWSQNRDGTGTRYRPGTSSAEVQNLTADVLLYAIWIGDRKVNFNGNAANAVGLPTPVENRVPTGGYFDIPATEPTRTGYRFDGWSQNQDGSGTRYRYNTLNNRIQPVSTDLTLYAQWVKQWTLSFDLQQGTPPGGNPFAGRILDAGATTVLPVVIPTLAGYEFTGWNTVGDGSGTAWAPGDAIENVSANITLYAQWVGKQKVIMYRNDGVSPPTTLRVHTGGDIRLSVDEPGRLGHRFTEWNNNQAGGGVITHQPGDQLTNVTADLSLYAQWVAVWQLSYNANGGAGAPAPFTVDHNTVFTLSGAVPTRENFTFTGWNTAQNGSGIAYAPGGTHTGLTGNTTLYAQWQRNQHTIAYSAGGGTGAPAADTLFAGLPFTLPAAQPTRTGYVFTGWNTAQNGSGTAYQPGDTLIAPNADLTLHAQWRLRRYVRYDVGEGVGAPATAELTPGAAYTIPSTPRPTNAGYIFAGWNTAADGTGTTYQPGESFTAPNADLALYAQWRHRRYIQYDVGEGAGAPAPAEMAVGEDFTLPAEKPTRTGYRFDGWNTAADGTGQSYAAGETFTAPDEDLTLFAQWRVRRYTLRYRANGGDTTTKPANVTDIAWNTKVTLSKKTPQREGYVFRRWNTQADGKGKSYKPGASVTLTAGLTLYAQWRLAPAPAPSEDSAPILPPESQPTPPPESQPAPPPPSPSGGDNTGGTGTGGTGTGGTGGVSSGTTSRPGTGGAASQPEDSSDSADSSLPDSSAPDSSASAPDPSSSTPAPVPTPTLEQVRATLSAAAVVGRTAQLIGLSPSALEWDPEYFDVAYDADSSTYRLTALKAGETIVRFTDEDSAEHAIAVTITEEEIPASGPDPDSPTYIWLIVAGGVVLVAAGITIPVLLKRRKNKTDVPPPPTP